MKRLVFVCLAIVPPKNIGGEEANLFKENENDEEIALLSWFGLDPTADNLLGEAQEVYAQQIQSIVAPPAACPGCVALAGQDWPAGYTSQFCLRCLNRLRCMQRARRWNTDHDHQVMAGKARARQFTHEYQAAAGLASFDAFSARWRAVQGLAPLSAEAVRRYLTPDRICYLGRPLDPQLQQTIYDAWSQGYLYHVTAWLDEGMADVLH